MCSKRRCDDTRREAQGFMTFEAWLEWYRSVCEIIPAHPADGGFQAEVCLWSLGGFAVNRTTAPPFRVVRNKRHLRREPTDHWIVSYYARGAHAANTAGTALEVPAGVPFLWSMGQEFVHERTYRRLRRRSVR
jgi:hypothetical protein